MTPTELPTEYAQSKWKETLTGIGGCLVYSLFGFGGIAVVITLFKKGDWLLDYGYPLAAIVSSIAFFILLPIALVLMIFKKTRGWGGFGLTIVSFMFGFTTWLWALIMAFAYAGLGWVIVGLFFYGMGIVPIAMIGAALHGEWGVTLELLVSVLIIYGLRMLGTVIVDRAEERFQVDRLIAQEREREAL
jgi:hypothetical protein